MAVPSEVLDRLRQADARTRIAVIGASRNPEKYGNKITRDLLARGYTVVPVNLRETTVEGQPAFPSIQAVPKGVHIANFVVPPATSLAIVRQLAPGTVEALWFQPGSFNSEVVAEARRKFSRVIAGDCIMVVARQLAEPR
jgi:predicted CoA-binding protein